MSGQRAHALAMAARGFRVFPLRRCGKLPAIDNFSHVATCDANTIGAWWTGPDGAELEYNIGIDTTGMVVADIDLKKGGYALDAYKEAGGHFDTLVVQTASGGMHGYFDGPDSKLAVNLLPGVDIRSHHGYVVGPGSYVDAALSGETGITKSGWYSILHDKPLSWCPPGIEARLQKPNVRRHVDYSIELDTSTAIANAAVWLQNTETATWGEGGDLHTYKVCAKLLRDYGLSEETAYALLSEHWNPRCKPHPWPLEMLWTKVQNAHNYATGDMGTARPEATFGGVTVIPPIPAFSATGGIEAGNALEAADLTPRPWLINRLAMTGDITVLAAGGSAGKSIWLLAAVAHFAVGKNFGPYKLRIPDHPLRTFVYNAEDDIGEQSRRLVAICQVFGLDYPTVKKNIVLMDDSQGEISLATYSHSALSANEPHVQFMTETLIAQKVDIAIFDPLINLHTCNENDNGQMRFVISTIRRIARGAGVAIMLSHHTSKSAGRVEQGDPAGIRGAGAIINSARLAIMMSGPSAEDRKNYGLDDKERHFFVRLDDAKANMFMRSSDAIMWTRWQASRLMTGDIVGVPFPVEMDGMSDQQTRNLAEALHTHIINAGTGGIIVAEAVRVLRAHNPLYEKMCDKSTMPLRRLVERTFMRPVFVGKDAVVIHSDGDKSYLRIM